MKKLIPFLFAFILGAATVHAYMVGSCMAYDWPFGKCVGVVFGMYR